MDSSVDAILGPDSPLARRLSGYEHREGQLAMARAVDAALRGDTHLFVEAGTGTGKTLAYLVPAILSGRKVVVSTATHALEEQIFTKDLPLVRGVLAEHGITFKAALMKGLANYVCKRRLNERLRSGEPVTAELAQIERWALESRSGDRAELVVLPESAPAWRDVHSGTDTRIGAGCKYFDECFVTQMRREAEQADVVIVNHHLFFADLALRTAKGSGFGGAIPTYDAVIFDEAHQIETIATDFFGARISSTRVDVLVRDARRAIVSARVLDALSMRLVDEVEHASQAFFRAWSGAGGFAPATAASARGARRGGGGNAAPRSSPSSSLPPSSGVDARRLLTYADWNEARRSATVRLDVSLEALGAFARSKDEHDALGILARRISDLRADLVRIEAASAPPEESHWEPDDAELDAVRKAGKGYEGGVTWLDTRERSVSLGASPVDLGPMLRERLFERIPSVVCTSATLATSTHVGRSFHFAKSRLGAPPDTPELVVPSPFDFERRAALYVAEDLPEPSDPAFDAASAARTLELVTITGGGAFVLCTSNRAMKLLYASLAGKTKGPLFVQGEAPKHVILERFRATNDAVLVATMSFWEGVDVPGDALRLVVIDRIPFAVPTDPVVVARSASIEADGGNPFTEYSVPSAAITLKQGFGRLIRTRKDAGVIALLDRRATRRGYGKALLASLPPARRLRSIEEVRAVWPSLGAVADAHPSSVTAAAADGQVC